MTTSVVSRNERNSLSLVISYARSQTLKGDGIAAREDVARRIWGEIYQEVPKLSYAQKERPLRNQLTARWNSEKLPIIQGNPDPAKGLLKYLIRQGLPDCLATARITHAAMYALRDLGILTEQARQDADACLYEQHAPPMHFTSPKAETEWYQKNIIIKEYPLTNHKCTLVCNPDEKECMLPKPWATKVSSEVEQRRKLGGNDRPDITNYLWKFSHSAWESKTNEYNNTFNGRREFVLSNLEQALRQR